MRYENTSRRAEGLAKPEAPGSRVTAGGRPVFAEHLFGADPASSARHLHDTGVYLVLASNFLPKPIISSTLRFSSSGISRWFQTDTGRP